MLKKKKICNFYKFSIFRNFTINLTHTGPSKMVNVGSKPRTVRYARASCILKFTNKEVLELLKSNTNSKGDVIRTSEIAGIMAAKKTSDLIPLCHQINLNTVNISIKLNDDKIK
jgi:molybdenum cofactor biosynthesis protein MoaC